MNDERAAELFVPCLLQRRRFHIVALCKAIDISGHDGALLCDHRVPTFPHLSLRKTSKPTVIRFLESFVHLGVVGGQQGTSAAEQHGRAVMRVFTRFRHVNDVSLCNLLEQNQCMQFKTMEVRVSKSGCLFLPLNVCSSHVAPTISH